MKKLRSIKINSGQALIELSLLFPIFLALLLGTLEFGRLFWEAHTLSRAAQESAKVAAKYNVTQMKKSAEDAVYAQLANYPQLLKNVQTTVTVPADTNTQPVIVTLTSTFSTFYGNLLPSLNKAQLSFSGSAFTATLQAQNAQLPPSPTPIPTPTGTPNPSSTPQPSGTPQPTPSGQPSGTPEDPGPTPEPSDSPEPTPRPTPTPVGEY